ncbi:MAG: DUF6807 family protein [Thermoguttaceae bacterium]|jgi:hypothetical protein
MLRSFFFGILFAAAGIGVFVATSAVAENTAALGAGFSLRDKPGQYLDVLLDGRVVGRYMYACDRSTPQRQEETYKPYLHVFDAEGKAPITKGPGGLYTHHRGIFIGWQRILFQGKRYNLWEMGSGRIVHREFSVQKASPDQATVTSLTDWNDNAGKPIVEEQRTMIFRRAPAPFRLMIDFTATLTAPRGNVRFEADPEHGGVQFRPANEIVKKETVYVFPKEHAQVRTDVDYPWVGETYTLKGKRYSVVDLNHPDNPKGTKFSAYRDYGRFGAYAKKEIASGQSLTLKYRFLIAEGAMPGADAIQKCWDEFTGMKSPAPVPKTTVRPADAS